MWMRSPPLCSFSTPLALRRKRFPRGHVPRRTWLIGLGGLTLIALALWFPSAAEPPGAPAPVQVFVPVGATFRSAADSLAAARLVRSARLFSMYATLRGRDRTIRAGRYRIEPGQSWDELINTLHTGRGVLVSVTIPEGWRLRQIVPRLAQALEIPRDSLNAAARDSATRARLGVPTETLEGYLFPDTYMFALGTNARQVVDAMVRRFERAWRPEWDVRLGTLRRTRHEIVTLASIVEKEVRLAEERPVVAAVYWNRLRIGMALQADPTVIYALNRATSRVMYADLEVNSPYNTYRRPGLPPGPIASPGASALEAVLHPAQVPYRYFVAHPDGHHEFRSTYREHLVAIQQVRARARADSVRRARTADSTAAARDSTGDAR